MLRNIELKARCADLASAREAVRALGAREQGVLVQTDTYFHVPNGRLKLREIRGAGAELIWYARPDSAGFRASDYVITPIADAQTALAVLSSALGVRARVHNRRELWLLENVRIHLDDVEELGTFVEYEAVIDQAADERSHDLLDRLKRAMKIQVSNMIGGSLRGLDGTEERVKKLATEKIVHFFNWPGSAGSDEM
jgi:adenylate cyclase class 2